MFTLLKGIPNVIKFIESFTNNENGVLCLEFIPNSNDLFDLINKQTHFCITNVIKIMHGILSGLNNIRENHIIHQDIKPENIMIDEFCNVKIIDFGLSSVTNNDECLNEVVGTYDFLCPAKREKTNYSYDTDIYATGLVMYSIYNNNCCCPDELLTKSLVCIPEQMQMIIVKLLEPNRLKRINAKNALDFFSI